MLKNSVLTALKSSQTVSTFRTIANIPAHEHHIRFDMKVGRKRPCSDALDRFKRLNNGMWIRAHPGRNKLRYMKDDVWQRTSTYFETCTQEECRILDKLTTPYWLRPKHYPNDPYQAYHVRHDLSSPRVDDRNQLVRERKKVLLDDTTSQRHFRDC